MSEVRVAGYHADNVAASVLGNFVLIPSIRPLVLKPLTFGTGGKSLLQNGEVQICNDSNGYNPSNGYTNYDAFTGINSNGFTESVDQMKIDTSC